MAKPKCPNSDCRSRKSVIEFRPVKFSGLTSCWHCGEVLPSK